jgi:hypothetical protein
VAKIFISYMAKDRTWADWIGVTLRDKGGHTPFVYQWEVGPGINIPRWMEQKIDTADHLLGVFTDAYCKAIHSSQERWAAVWQDPEGKDGFLVPVEVERVTKWPPLARPLNRLSLVDRSEEDAEKAILEFFQPPSPPTTRPTFPGRGGTGGATAADRDERGGTTMSDTGSASSGFASDAAAFTDRSEGLPMERPPLPRVSRTDEPPDLSDQEVIRQWLESKQREWSVVIAARAALRVVPLAGQPRLRARQASAVLLPVFRATAIARFAAVYPNRAIEAIAAADAAYEAAVRTSAFLAPAAYAAAWTAAQAAARTASTEAANLAAEAAAYAADAPGTSSDAVYGAVQQDAVALANGIPAAGLARAPLWQNGEGINAFRQSTERFWVELRNNLISLGSHWKVWTDWYDEALGGSPPLLAHSEAWDAAFTDVQDPSYLWKSPLPWDNGPEVVNLAIKARLDATSRSRG